VRHLHCNVKPSLAFCQGGKAGLALALAAHYCVRFPVSGFPAAIHRLVPLADRLSLAVLSLRFLNSVALSLAARYFQIAIYQVLLIDPAVNRSPAGHLQFTRGTG